MAQFGAQGCADSHLGRAGQIVKELKQLTAVIKQLMYLLICYLFRSAKSSL
jgi:hypothetical protein